MDIQTEIRHRFALLIGVRDYVDPIYRKIPQTVYDVTVLEKVLTKLGYTVNTLHSDKSQPNKLPTRDNIFAELRNIAGISKCGDLLLVYFGGHGDLDRNQTAYLIPYGGRKTALEESAIDLEKFKEEIVKAGAQVKILILDACHSEIGRDATGMSMEFERHVFLEAQGTATLSACKHNERAWNHDTTPHGVFTYYLLKGLQGEAPQKNSRFITFNDINDYVTYMVKSWAYQNSKQQCPISNNKLVGDPPLVELTHHHTPRSFFDIKKILFFALRSILIIIALIFTIGQKNDTFPSKLQRVNSCLCEIFLGNSVKEIYLSTCTILDVRGNFDYSSGKKYWICFIDDDHIWPKVEISTPGFRKSVALPTTGFSGGKLVLAEVQYEESERFNNWLNEGSPNTLMKPKGIKIILETKINTERIEGIKISSKKYDFEDYSVFSTSKIFVNLRMSKPIQQLWIDWETNISDNWRFSEINREISHIQEDNLHYYSVSHDYSSLGQKNVIIKIILEGGIQYCKSKEIEIK
jgi:hypothetical protein